MNNCQLIAFLLFVSCSKTADADFKYNGPRKDALIGFWPYDGATRLHVAVTGPQTLIKSAGAINPAYLNRVEFKPGPFEKENGAISVGIDASVQVLPPGFLSNYTLSIEKMTELTVSFWYYPGKEVDYFETKLMQIGGGKVNISHQDGKMKFKYVNESTKPISEASYPFAWQFYAFTVSSTTFSGYQMLSAVHFLTMSSKTALDDRWQPKVVFGGLNPGDRMACVAIFAAVLSQSDISRLPRLCTAKPFVTKSLLESPKTLLYFPLEPIIGPFGELSSGMLPSAMFAALTDRLVYSTTLSLWPLSFELPPAKMLAYQFTLTFYYYCEALDKMVGILQWHLGSTTLSMVGCNSIQTSSSKQQQPVRVRLRFPGRRWNYIAIVNYNDTHSILYDDAGFLNFLGSFDATTTGDQLVIGPYGIAPSDGRFALRCLYFFNEIVPWEQLAEIKCYCPSFANTFFTPTVLAQACGGLDYISQHALFIYYLDAETGTQNVAREGNRNMIRFEPQFQLDSSMLGPFGEPASSYINTLSDAIRFTRLPIISYDFTISYAVRFEANRVSGMTLFSMETSEDELMLAVQLAGKNWRTIAIRGPAGYGNRYIESRNVVKPEQWALVSLVYNSESKIFWFYQQTVSSDQDDDVKEVFEQFYGNYEASQTLKAVMQLGKDFDRGDRLSCITYFKMALPFQYLRKLPCTCKSKGHCTEFKEESSPVQSDEIPADSETPDDEKNPPKPKFTDEEPSAATKNNTKQ